MKTPNHNLIGLRIRYLLLIDLFCITLALIFSFVIRYEALVSVWPYLRQDKFLFVLIPLIRLPVYYAFRLYRRLWRYASTREFAVIVLAGGAGSLLVYALNFGLLRTLGGPYCLSRSVIVLEALLSTAFLGITRFLLRMWQERMTPQDAAQLKALVQNPLQVLIVGAGDAGEILRVADHYGLRVIDDSCEALGAEYKGRKLGQFGDAAAFAFYPNKQMTTGEGGIIVTDDDEIAMLARSMRNQGRDEMGAWLEHVRLGYNYRMDEMSAALGVSQFKRLETFLQKREQVARMYTKHLQGLEGVHPPSVKPYVRMSWFVYVVTLAEGLARDPLMALMAKRGVPTRGYFAPIHTQRYISGQLGDLSGTLPLTESVAQRTIALPFSAIMTETQVTYVCEVLKACLAKVILG